MPDGLDLHRLQFAFTIIFHYIFPQLTMGLALFIVLLKYRGLRTGEARFDDAARFWIKVFGITFAVGVATGIPMEFQFGTNWSRFTEYAGGVVGHTLGMEGLFAFFLESSFLALLVFGERRLSRKAHFGAALALWIGSWLSGFFITATNAFMQHPVGYEIDANGNLQLADFWTFITNPWALVQYPHTILGAVVTGSFAVAGLGAWWTLRGEHTVVARTNLAYGTTVGLIAAVLVAFPTGDLQGKLVAKHKPIALAAMEGRFETGTHAEITLIGQPNVKERKLDNPIAVPGILSFIAYGSFSDEVKGLNEYPESEWPTNIELVYYSFHIMAGLGTLFILLMAVANLWRWRGRLHTSRALLWMLMLAVPFPFIANTVGWMTAELGRQPWVIYGLMRTEDASSPNVHGGTTLFSLIGFMGIYFVLGCLYLFLVGREIAHGPQSSTATPAH
ncbi:MAG: cytochrome ubiquinol oxidase subunit I [Planctomycetes bacterium]|nr:cytochrome ubiquinol oxidase subunit I [Planctomycetota bacterium]